MKRILSIILVSAMLLSLSGCYVSFDKDAFVDYVEEEVSIAVDSVVDKAKEEVSSKVDEIVDVAKEKSERTKKKISSWWDGVWDKICFWKTSTDDENTIESCVCSTFALDKVTKDKFFTKEREDTYVLQCKDCKSAYPVEQLKFSVFLEYFYPNQNQEKLSQKKKEKALDPYIRTKALMSEAQMEYFGPYTPLMDEDPTPFQLVGAVAGSCSEILETVTGQDSKAFFLSSVAVSTAVIDLGGTSGLLAAVDKSTNIASIVLSLTEYLTAAVDAGEKATKYEKTNSMGVEYTYFERNDYIDLAIANANVIAKLANFIGNVNPINPSVNALSPDADGLLKDVEWIAEEWDLGQVYRILVYPINGDVTISYILLDYSIDEEFVEINSYDKETIEKAMSAGPCAKDIGRVISDIINQTENIEGSKEKVASALWYYYGWRLQYEYNMFLEWIYADEPDSFESFMKNSLSMNAASGQ